jgi:hypothetical protein
MRTACSMPVHRSWRSVYPSSRRHGTASALGLTHRTKATPPPRTLAVSAVSCAENCSDADGCRMLPCLPLVLAGGGDFS